MRRTSRFEKFRWGQSSFALCVVLTAGAQFVTPHVGGRVAAIDPSTSQVDHDLAGLAVEEISNKEDISVATSSGDFFQQQGCPYSISEREASEIFNQSSAPGNTITVDKFAVGRVGNHFESLSLVLSMGYCCRSRLVSLPRQDDHFPTESGATFQANQHLFRFSQAILPSEDYMQLRDDPDACTPTIELRGRDSFFLSGFSAALLSCMNDVYVRGCERAYLGPELDKEVICPKQDPLVNTGAGTLVINIRSGDILTRHDYRKVHHGPYGQPPLQFYLHAINEKKWKAVTVLTWSMDDSLLNPTYTTLEMMQKAGSLGENVQLFRNRSIWEDLREMICADGLVTARSSLSFPMIALSRASVYVIPNECGLGAFRRTNGLIAMDRYDNTTLLRAEKPNAEVFGIEWHEGMKDYSVYREWNGSDCAQRMEMVTYGGIKKLKKCD